MIQIFGSLTLIFAILLPVLLTGAVAFKLAMDAHADFYRYEQSHHLEQAIEAELQEHDWTNGR